MVNYPIQLDEIDQWLADNFGILPGACASTENLRHNTARMIAEALWPEWKNTSQELEEAAEDCAEHIDEYGDPYPAMIDAFKAGAEWQKEQDHDACYQCEKNYDTVFFKGEQHAIKMMKEEAIERTVKEDAGGYPYIDETELYDYEKDEPTAKKGDKVGVYIFRNNK